MKKATKSEPSSIAIGTKLARRLWIKAQALDKVDPFAKRPKGTSKVSAAIEHLGYVQIDTIHVIERCHHHILYNRIPDYHVSDLTEAQAEEKSVFEYWTHALSYVPTKDFKYFVPAMKQRKLSRSRWFQSVKEADLKKVLSLIRKSGPISIRDIEDDVLVEKDHDWASKKPSKRALQLAFFQGDLVISKRLGMLKQYELTKRHFQWDKIPKAATAEQTELYMLERALRSQCLVSLDSICHLEPSKKAGIKKLIQAKVKKSELLPVHLEGHERVQHWMLARDYESLVLDSKSSLNTNVNFMINERVHILSPFDPLIIQRKRLKMFFDYNHIFEAYVPKAKRRFGYFALPVLIGDEVVASLDLKTDREQGRLLIQQWNWIGLGAKKSNSKSFKKLIEADLHRFEKFQLGY